MDIDIGQLFWLGVLAGFIVGVILTAIIMWPWRRK